MENVEAGFISYRTKRNLMIFLIDWLQANLLMAATALVLIGIPAVILYIVFANQKKKGEE